ncbi:FAD-binding protein [Sphingomonas immobilis]|uniref:FAD-binding protein n=1 Tax=Sphingomonas immobilis TaxID=3063997 RepID=A0ABT8ZX84_9SPHN|nr:FAD-binding protein [Sphingomonas sp. CA1-15]MDO7842176.1 FAD-binding protein [Sphingomonas sp. CA1-15]
MNAPAGKPVAAGELLDCVPDTGTEIGAAIVVADADAFAWDDQCDMLVIGFGLAGAAAALKGAELGGMDVVLADRFDGGGTSALSGGVVYSGGGTRVQKELGIADSADNLAEYMAYEAGEVRKASTIRRFADRSASMIDWLEARGVSYGGPLETRKTSYPPASKFLYYSGNEVAPAYATADGPAPRGHRAIPTREEDYSKYSGFVLMSTLQRYIEADTPIRLKLKASARRLVVDGTGRVIGAELWQIPPGSAAAEKHSALRIKSQSMMRAMLGLTQGDWRKMAAIERKEAKPLLVRARRGVVLSTGGYGNNPEMLKRTAPEYVGNRIAGTPGCDGSAVRLGAAVGAALGQMHLCSPWRFIAPPISWMKGVLVGPEGTRIVNEQLYGANVGNAIMTKAGGKAWLITDQPLQDKALAELKDKELWPFQRLPGKFLAWRAKKASTIAGLEKKIGLPSGSLQRTMTAYNDAIRAGRPDAEGKGDEQRVLLETGPFYAMNQSAGVKLNPIGQITLGGLLTDEDSNAVLGTDGAPVTGLYAAGRSAVGLCSQNYVSGMSLADCIFSGWTAAEAIAGNREPA